MLSILRVAILNPVDPTEFLSGLDRSDEPLFELLLRMKLGQADKFLVDAREVFLLEDDRKSPVIVVTDLKNRASGEQSIERQTNRQSREPLFEPSGEPIKSLQFTILFGRIGVRILNELAQEREGEAIRGDELGFQHVMIEGRHSIVSACQTVFAVAFGEAVDTSAVNGDDVVTIEQAIAFEDFFANQDFEEPSDTLLDLRWRDVFESVIESVAVRRVLDSEQAREIGRRRRVVSELECDLAARRQMTEKHQKACEEQAVQGVDDLARIARVVDSGEEATGQAKEVRDCRHRDVEQGLQLLLREFDWSGPGDFRWNRKEFGDDFGVCSLLSMIHPGIVGALSIEFGLISNSISSTAMPGTLKPTPSENGKFALQQAERPSTRKNSS